MMSTTVPPDDVQKAQPNVPAPRALHDHAMHPARALLRKEFNELLAWFIGLLVPYGCVLAWAAWNGSSNSFLFKHFYPDRGANPYLVSAVACPAIGLLMGAYQFLNESSFDTYALLVHRPLSRARIFWLKTIAGLAAYLMTTGLPFVALVLWALSLQERSPEALPWLTRGMSGTLVVGALFYFAGVVLATRKVKWYGTLWLPAIWPILAMLLILGDEYPEPWQRVGFYLLAAVPLVIAARWSFVTLGQIRQQPWYARLSLAATICAGFGVLLTIAYGFVFSVTNMIPTDIESYWAETLVLKDGTIVRGIYNNSSDRSGQRQEWLNYGDRYVPANALQPVFENLAVTEHLLSIPESRNEWLGMLMFDRGHQAEPHSVGQNVRSHWLRINDTVYEAENDGGFIGLYEFNYKPGPYDKRSEMLGFAGPDGVELGKNLPKKLFHGPAVVLPPVGVLTPEAIYQIMPDGTLKVVFTPPDGTRFTNRSTWLTAATEGNPVTSGFFLTTPKNLYDMRMRYDRFANEFTFEVRNTTPLERDAFLVVMTNKEKIFALRYDQTKSQSKPSLLVRYLPDGSVDRQEVPAPGWHESGHWKKTVVQATLDATKPFAVNLWQAGWSWYRHWHYGTIYYGPGDEVRRINISDWSVIIGALTAAIMWLIMMRQSFGVGRMILWCALGFVGGPAVLLLRPAIVPTRVLERCPDCQRKRPVELMQCPHCSKRWPAPERDGREIIVA